MNMMPVSCFDDEHVEGDEDEWLPLTKDPDAKVWNKVSLDSGTDFSVDEDDGSDEKELLEEEEEVQHELHEDGVEEQTEIPVDADSLMKGLEVKDEILDKTPFLLEEEAEEVQLLQHDDEEDDAGNA